MPQKRKKEIFLPEVIGGGYRGFWESKDRYRVVKGGKASKKSVTTALWFIYKLMKYPLTNLLVVRNVYSTHYNSTFAQLNWAINRLDVRELWKSTLAPLEMRYLPTGQRIIFRGFDDVDKLASTTVDRGNLCWVWIEEAFEIESENDFDKLDLSVPRGKIQGNAFKQTTLTFNPWYERHWLKSRFFDNKHNNIFTLTTTYKQNEFLDETDLKVFERLEKENYNRYKVIGLGQGGVSSGLIYENWETEKFDIEKIKMDENSRNVFGLDYGYTNDPTAFVALGVNEKEKKIYVFDEYYKRKMLNSQIAKMIEHKGYSKERIIADSAEPKSNDDLFRLGISRIKPARKGADSVINGITRIQEYQIIVHESCVNTIDELNSYAWHKKTNKPVDKDNHIMDAMRYAMEDVRVQKRNVSLNNSGKRSINVRNRKKGWF